MQKHILLLSILTLAACTSDAPTRPIYSAAPAYDTGDIEYECGQCGAAVAPAPVTQVEFSTPRGNDLLLETPRHIIHVTGQPNVPYAYGVWLGDRDMTDDPDMVVAGGAAAILVE